MASQPGPLYAFPWERFGSWKYALLLPFAATVALGADDADGWAWHMLTIALLRYAHAQAWNTLSRLHSVSAGTRITAKPVEFRQVDRESNWDDFILLQALVMTLVHNLPGLGFAGFPAWSGRGLVQLLLLHAGPTEFLYYWLHRALHWHPLYQRYHSHHHASFVAEPITGARHERRGGRGRGAGKAWQPGNRLRAGWLAAHPARRLQLPACWLWGWTGRKAATQLPAPAAARHVARRDGSLGSARAPSDASPSARQAPCTRSRSTSCTPPTSRCRCWARGPAAAPACSCSTSTCSASTSPTRWATATLSLCPPSCSRCAAALSPPQGARQLTRLPQALPVLKYLIYTPTFHALHHSQVKTNFCLFMPLYDYVYGTVDAASWSLHASALAGTAVPVVAPDAVFLAHGTEVLSLLHLPFAFRGLAAHPWAPPLAFYLLWPLLVPLALCVAAFGRVFTADKHSLGPLRLETWVTPAFGIQYFIKSQAARLNGHIAGAIAEADASGVRVIGLGALNKAEALNGGGRIFVEASPHLRVRVVHGNTLTAAAILQKIPPTARRVFLTGATSKLGRALALYLSARGVEVLLLTSSDVRFDALVAEADEKARGLLVRARGVRDAKDVDCWIVGKHLSAAEQRAAPSGTTFHQFVVPPIAETRPDCSYTELPAFRLPKEARGLRSCEMTMPRGCVHACHAGALVHVLEGWSHHEVGAVPPERIDLVWEASLRHGFELVL